MAALGGAQRVEGLHDREAAVAGSGQRGQATGPADRVHDVGLVAVPELGQAERERADVGQRVLVGQRFGRAGRDVTNAGAAGQLVLVGQGRRVLAGVHRHVVVLAGQRLRPARLRGSPRWPVRRGGARQGSGFFGNKGDLHEDRLLAAMTLATSAVTATRQNVNKT